MFFLFNHHRPLTKKEKKELQLKKNKFNQEFFNFVRQRKCEEQRVKALAKAKERPKEKEKDEDKPVWSAKVTTIRNRLNDKRRTSEDRWNRFAGTSDAGGRGR